MPWKECKPMDERLRFIARLLEGEKMAPLCREFGISRVTGYKIFNRYRECGLDALYDRSRRPYRQGMDPADALGVIKAASGTQFDPGIVHGFLSAYREGKLPLNRQSPDEEPV